MTHFESGQVFVPGQGKILSPAMLIAEQHLFRALPVKCKNAIDFFWGCWLDPLCMEFREYIIVNRMNYFLYSVADMSNGKIW